MSISDAGVHTNLIYFLKVNTIVKVEGDTLFLLLLRFFSDTFLFFDYFVLFLLLKICRPNPNEMEAQIKRGLEDSRGLFSSGGGGCGSDAGKTTTKLWKWLEWLLYLTSIGQLSTMIATDGWWWKWVSPICSICFAPLYLGTLSWSVPHLCVCVCVF